VKDEQSISPVVVEETAGCANAIPAPLDILVLYDNTVSMMFHAKELKSAVRDLATGIKYFKDYNICFAPLVADATSSIKCQSYVTTMNPQVTGLEPIGISSVPINTFSSNDNQEKGIGRAFDMLSGNRVGKTQADGDPIFRGKSYSVIIVISNGDDTEYCSDGQGNYYSCDMNNWLNKYSKLISDNGLKQLRFISVVNYKTSSTCGSSIRNPGVRYKSFSQMLYDYQGINDDNRVDSDGVKFPDSYDLCVDNLSSIFSNIASTINQFKVGLTYHSWPLGDMTNKDPAKLVLKKSTGEILKNNNTSNGYTYNKTTAAQNIVECPAQVSPCPVEMVSGPFAKLYNSAKVTYPECLIVKKENFTRYYGYYVLADEPDLQQMKVYINGQLINPSSTDGWSYEGFAQSTYLLVVSPTNPVPAAVPTGSGNTFYRTGYVLKMHGSAIYQDGDKVEVAFKKSSK
jgi:hypothetical protein